MAHFVLRKSFIGKVLPKCTPGAGKETTSGFGRTCLSIGTAQSNGHWARSSNAVQVPVLKTTMIVESHWRRLKHDYLHRFNRPRIDLVTWILAKRVIPEATEKMKGLIEGNHRMATAAWRKPFKRQWKALQDKEVNPDSLLRYHTAPMKWVCACEAFLESRFLLCKHLKHCLERFSNPSVFFREVRRRRTSPFWEHAQCRI